MTLGGVFYLLLSPSMIDICEGEVEALNMFHVKKSVII